jgi:uncharacterized protein YceK
MKNTLILLSVASFLSGCQSISQEEANRRYEERQHEQVCVNEKSKTAEGIAGLLNFLSGK